MSGWATFMCGEAIVLVTDGASYLSDGTIEHIGAKVDILPHLNAAITSRGAEGPLSFIRERMRVLPQSFDQLVADIPVMTAELLGDLDEPLEIVTVGWSERRGRPQAYALTNAEFDLATGKHTIIAWNMLALPGPLHFAPSDGPVESKIENLFEDKARRGALSLDDGVTILKILRSDYRQSLPGDDADTFSLVGGFVQLTAVFPNVIESGIFHRWPDRIGERINADAEFAAC